MTGKYVETPDSGKTVLKIKKPIPPITKKIKRIFVSGLALDYCCYYTAMDGLEFGYEVYFLVDLTRGVDLPEGNVENALKNLKKAGIKFVKNESFK